MKKVLIILISVLLLVGCQRTDVSMSGMLIKNIDDNCKQSGSCNIKMKNVTWFEWDNVVIFEVGSSNDEISKALGVKYEDSTDLMSGIVFILDKRIVCKETSPYNPEHPSKLQYNVDNKPGEPNYMAFTPDNALFVGSKENFDGVYYYKITH